MKKISVLSVLGALIAFGAHAEFVDASAAPARVGFVGDDVIVTVRQLREMRDDVPVTVQGKIVQRMGDEKYLFEDSTGSITVEIDDDDWRGQAVAPTDTVILRGEVDAGIFKTEIDVDSVQKM